MCPESPHCLGQVIHESLPHTVGGRVKCFAFPLYPVLKQTEDLPEIFQYKIQSKFTLPARQSFVLSISIDSLNMYTEFAIA